MGIYKVATIIVLYFYYIKIGVVMKNIFDQFKTQEAYQIFIQDHPCIILMLDGDSGAIIDANKAAEKFYGYSRQELVQMNIKEVNTYSDTDIHAEMQLAKSQQRNFFRFQHRTKSGLVKNVEVTSYPVKLEDQTCLFSVINVDKATKDMFDADSFDLLPLFNEAHNPVLIVDSEDIRTGNIVYCNQAMTEVVDIKAQDIYQLSSHDLFKDLSDDLVEKYMYSGGTHTLTLNNASLTPLEVQCTKIRHQGKVYSMLNLRIIEFKLIEGLTFNGHLEKLAFHSQIPGYLVAFNLYQTATQTLELEKFIQFIHKHLMQALDYKSIHYQVVEADNNILIFSPDDIRELSEALENFLDALRFDSNYVHYTKDFKFRAGVSKKAPLGKGLVNYTNRCLSSFAHDHFNDIIYFKDSLEVKRAQRIKRNLADAIINDEFVMYGQPIVNIKSQAIEAIELLIRWQHPILGLIEPADFIHYAEITGEIKNIDLLVIKKSIAFITDNQEALKSLKIHINLSSKSFENDDLFNLFDKYDYQSFAKDIVFEITEESNSEILTNSFLKAKNMGFSFSIDDFGTGFSSFERMRQTGIERIKIDRSFIKSITENPNDIVILKAVLDMCRGLKIDAIAEGIETKDQLEFLTSRNCNKIQGYYFSRPMDLDILLASLQSIARDIKDKIEDLKSPDVFKSQFYNKGRVFIQALDDAYGFIDPNIQLAQCLGYSLGEFLEIKMAHILSPEDMPYFEEACHLAQNNNEQIIVNTRLVHKSKDLLDARCALRFDQGRFYIYLEFMDTQDQDSELLGLSKSYTEAFYSSPVGMILLDENYTIFKLNPASQDILAQDVSGLGQNILKIYETDTKPLGLLLHQALKTGQATGILPLKTTKGLKVTDWMISTISDSKDRARNYICIIQDITEKLASEKEKNRIYNALNQSQSAVIMTDPGGNIQYVNKRFSTLTGYTYDHAMGKNVRLISSHEHPDEFYAKIWMTIRSGKTWGGEIHNKKKNGDFYWSYTQIYPIFEKGDIIAYMAIQDDKTDEKQLLNLNEDLKNHLYEQDKIASLGMLTSGIIHEINNPLAYIQMNLKYLTEEFEAMAYTDADQREEIIEALQDTTEGLNQIKEIANGLKKYIFKTDNDDLEEVNIEEIISEVLVLTKNEYKYYTNVHINLDGSQSYMIMGYASKLKQVIMNLIINATHAITSKNMEGLGTIHVDVDKNEHEVFIKISDNGIGMTPETIEKIFQPLFTTKERGIGTGLGLSVSKKIVEEDMKGTIQCSSQLGQGTSFLLSFKAMQA